MAYVFVILAVIIVIIIGKNILIVPQANSFIIERFGAFRIAWATGLHIKAPFIEKVYKRVDLKEQVFEFAPQPVITKDNVTLMMDTIVFFQVFDPKLFAYGVANPIVAIESLCATSLRNIVGELELDGTLTSRDVINSKMRATIDDATAPWGIKVTRVELKSISPPQSIRDAMEKQMIAERGKRAIILESQGRKESLILQAQADKEAAILRADAEKEKRIREAQGEAEAIMAVQRATAEGIRMIKEAGADEAVLRLESLSAFKAAADGAANKIIIPADMQNFAGIVTALGELTKSN